MKNLVRAYDDIKKRYDAGQVVTGDIFNISVHCLKLLESQCQRVSYGFDASKTYFAFSDISDVKKLSRPVNTSLYIADETVFKRSWDAVIQGVEQGRISADSEVIDRVLYTATVSFCCCYDIWKKSSRKTPGTYFEVFLGSLLSLMLPTMHRSKFIPLPGVEHKLSTDIFFKGQNGGLVIPAKITTRERIVQPYAHQRILDSVFGEQQYRSLLLCVSETRRNDHTVMVNDICVPGPIKLYQQHLSHLAGIYYMDPPARYLQEDVQSVVPVGCFSDLLTSKLFEITEPML